MNSKLKEITLRGKKLKLPAFFPDATYGSILTLNSQDILKSKTQGVVVNTYHLFRKGFVDELEKIGIHKFMEIDKPVLSDSGGFQIYSLIHKNPEFGYIDEEKAVFRLENGEEIHFTPEKAIQIQLKIGADIIMCLDDCRHADDKQMEESVERTISWARRCKDEYLRLTRNYKEKDKPLLFGIIQGGESKELRKYCSEKLIEIGFDGYAFGGWPIKEGKLLKKILKYTADLIPENKVKYAMGVGKPKDIIDCWKMGYNLFDCVIPTRHARHKRLFLWRGRKVSEFSIRKKNFNISFIKELYDLHQKNPNEGKREATINNLKVYSELMERLG